MYFQNAQKNTIDKKTENYLFKLFYESEVVVKVNAIKSSKFSNFLFCKKIISSVEKSGFKNPD